MTVKEIADIIEQFAPLNLQEDYDNCGLNVGDPQAEVTGVLLTVDVTQAVLDEAISHGMNLIISHHPLLFHPLKQIAEANFTQSIVSKAIRNGVNLYAAHTNLDSAVGGLSYMVGTMLELKSMKVLSPHSEGSVTGYGVVGELESGLVPTIDFLCQVKTIMGCGAIRHSALCHDFVSRIAISTGACASLTEQAIASGADIFLSADFRYNDFYTPDSRIIVADIGHFESENCAIDLLNDIFTKKISTFVVRKSESCINPVNYYY